MQLEEESTRWGTGLRLREVNERKGSLVLTIDMKQPVCAQVKWGWVLQCSDKEVDSWKSKKWRRGERKVIFKLNQNCLKGDVPPYEGTKEEKRTLSRKDR